MAKIRILLDMDEVICDFEGGALKIHGHTQATYEQIRSPGCWDMPKQLGITQDQFWQLINDIGERFWSDLEPLPWAHSVVDLIKSITDDWFVISCPSRHLSSRTGKFKWLKHFFGSRFDRFVLTSYKSIFAGPDVLLIDDKEENVAEFIKAGGQGVLFPTLSNAYHELAHDPMSRLYQILNRTVEQKVVVEDQKVVVEEQKVVVEEQKYMVIRWRGKVKQDYPRYEIRPMGAVDARWMVIKGDLAFSEACDLARQKLSE